jgi:hypothetical protein
MIAMRMMQVAIDEVIDVVAMRHRLVTAAGAVDMASLMPGALVVGGAGVGIRRADLDHMFIDMVPMRVMQMAVMQVIDVIAMANGGMAAARAMLVIVVLVMGMGAVRHGFFLSVQ